ncbi:peptide chain release factor 2 [Thermoflexus sp.]|uniref:peptide chain release factor 2 n=1 Tax=Thermoflexus sp. TaxID=1969742 RepID=UPI0035E45E59
MSELRERLEALTLTLEDLLDRLDIPKKQLEIQKLEEEAARPDLWDQPARAQELMRRLGRLKEEVESWLRLRHRIQEARELLDLVEAEGEEALTADLEREISALEEEVRRHQFEVWMSGPYDRNDAILAIHAGAGGTDAQDWAEMLLRMYLRWAERRGWESELLDKVDGEEAGIKSATVLVKGPYAYGYLKAEKGVHRLVRISPFDAAHRRHTSFALVEVWPDIGESPEIIIHPDDIVIETFRASTAGGQHMQKNETAVRIRHIPTGIVVSCQNERSQTQNKETALKILKARLAELEEQKRRAEIAALKGEHVSAEWGNQIRSYVLHPYQLVKDHRTDYETSQVERVLDGELDEFIEAYLRQAVAPSRS